MGRFATVRHNGVAHGARVEGEDLLLGPPGDAVDATTWSQFGGPRIPLAAAELAPPSLRPSKILCVGLNYRSHILEMGRELPDHPTLFAKFPEAVIGPHDPIHLPAFSTQVDWEAELCVVIGAGVRSATRAEARRAIGGFTVANDVTVRDWQWRTTQWLAGKTLEGSCPVGPVLATPDTVDDARDLEVRCEVDGVLMQKARTSDLLFDPAALVQDISAFVTLNPGDLILTGTPAGVGAARDPNQFLQPGTTVRTTIEGIGTCENVCVEAAQ